jgi:hypothetical protein
MESTEKPFSWDTSKAISSKREDINYTFISYISSKKKPDIYVGNDVILAKNYRVNNIEKEKPKEEEKEFEKTEDLDGPELIITKKRIFE